MTAQNSIAMPVATPTMSKPAAQKRKRGFTLTEIAIVLGIIGLILGAIWVAAAAVYNNLRVSKANTEILSITQAVRALYATSQTTGDANGTAETTPYMKASIFPIDALDTGIPATATKVNGPWANSVILVYSSESFGGSIGDSFQLAFANIPQQACIVLVTSTTGAGRDQGLTYVAGVAGATATAVAVPGAYLAPGALTAFPISATAATAAGICGTVTAPNLVNITWTFKLAG